MDYILLLKQLEQQILPHLPEDEETKDIFLKQIKLLKRGFIGSDFKLKRTIQDKQITTNVLENTITELKIQTENLKHQKTLTEEQAAFKEQLFANVSHELRTPIHGILGMSHLLENTTINEEQQGFIDIIRSSADNLLVIVNDLLNLSKINAGKTTLINEPFSIEKFISDLKGVLTFKAKGKGIDFIVFLAPNLPKFLLGDRTRLYQVLINLLNNAIKFTEKGYVALNIYLIKKNQNQVELQFDIKDTGIGIETTKLTSIFESFTQLNKQSGELYGGVGLGLNITKKLLSIMKGTFKVKSKKGNGTTFTVNLPFELPSETQIENLGGEHKTTFNIPKNWQQKKILMIEDNEVNLVYAQNLFASWQLNLEVAENLAVADKKLHQDQYDCILSDVKLPDGNGLDLIAQMRADNSAINQTTPIIVLTASANDKEASYAKKLNVQSYIGKPFPPQLLIREMSKIFQWNKKVTTDINIESSNFKLNNATSETPYFANLEKNFKGRPKLQIEMFDIFLVQLPEAVQKMGKGLEENDLALFHYDAHRIKSTINIIGLPKLKPLITKMDEYCYKKINLEELPQLYQLFKKQAAIDIELILARKESLLVTE